MAGEESSLFGTDVNTTVITLEPADFDGKENNDAARVKLEPADADHKEDADYFCGLEV